MKPTSSTPAADGYTTVKDKNCFASHNGARKNIDVGPQRHLSVEQCKQSCDADMKCDCVTRRNSNGDCWKGSGCTPTKCQRKGGFTSFVKEQQQAKKVSQKAKEETCGERITMRMRIDVAKSCEGEYDKLKNKMSRVTHAITEIAAVMVV